MNHEIIGVDRSVGKDYSAVVRGHNDGGKVVVTSVERTPPRPRGTDWPVAAGDAWMSVSRLDSMRLKCGDIVVEGGVSLEVVDKFYVMQGLSGMFGEREPWLAPPHIMVVRALDVK